MNIVEKNEGTKIGYEVNKKSICFDDDLTINLAKRQKDWPVHIDVCSDDEGALVIGAEAGRYYVAEVDLPAIEYDYETQEAAEEGEEPTVIATPKELDMDKVTLSLWALENRVPVEA